MYSVPVPCRSLIHEKLPIRFDDEGQEVFVEWYKDEQKTLRGGNLDDALQHHFAKYPGLFARLALVVHLARYACDETKVPALADEKTALAVREFIDGYLRPHARRIYTHLGVDRSREGARRIARWIKQERIESFTMRDVRQKNWSGLTDRNDVAAALEILQDGGWIFASEKGPSSKGGRPTTKFRVNPTVLL